MRDKELWPRMSNEKIPAEDARRARKIAKELANWVGATIMQSAVVLVRQGAPIHTEPAMYEPADLETALALGLVEKRMLTISGVGSGTGEMEIFAAVKTAKNLGA